MLPLFSELASCRTSSFGEAQPIAWAEIEAWARLFQTPLTSFEARALRELDAAWIAVYRECQAQARAKH